MSNNWVVKTLSIDKKTVLENSPKKARALIG